MIARTLLVFAKAPRLGQGKTRLAGGLGRVEALRINRWLHARAMRAAADPRWRVELRRAPDGAACGLWPKAFARANQGSGDLGARLARAFRAHPNGPLAVIGADAPEISAGAIWSAFRALSCARYAVGPAPDGGFWIFAARNPRRAARAFAAVRWSSPQAMADLLSALDAPAVRLAALSDLDTIEDWRAFNARRRARIPSSS